MQHVSRRQFFKTSGIALGAAGLMYSLGRLPAFTQAANDYKALVCIFLQGGNDFINTVTPLHQDEYKAYQAARGTLAISAADLLKMNPPQHKGAFGMNPFLTELHQLWGAQKLAVINNVGNLLYPITKQEYATNEKVRPLSLFDHSAQEIQAQLLGSGDNSGWGQRVGTLVKRLNGGSSVPLLMNVSAGTSVYLSGTEPYITLKNEGITTLQGFTTAPESAKRLEAMVKLRRLAPDAPIVDYVGDHISLSVDNARLAAEILSDPTPLETDMPRTSLGLQLTQIAKLIKNRDALGLSRRQVFYATLGGFDTHGTQAQVHPKLLTELDEACGAFQRAMVELQVAPNVTTFTLSEFGRTIGAASDGTDHAWGGSALVFGDAVKGGEFYGQYPSLIIGSELDIDGQDGVNRGDARGRLLPTTSIDQYAATLAKWFGLSNSDIDQAIPNITRFSPRDLGFMMGV